MTGSPLLYNRNWHNPEINHALIIFFFFQIEDCRELREENDQKADDVFNNNVISILGKVSWWNYKNRVQNAMG